MRLLANPVILRALITFLMAAMAFVLGWWLIRRMRQDITNETQLSSVPRAETAGFEAAAYQGVIQRLKQQVQELQNDKQTANDRAAAAERLNAVLMGHMSCGAVLFNSAGLVQQANEAGRALLGYSSVSGMSARDLFARVLNFGWEESEPEAAPQNLAEAVELAVRSGCTTPGMVIDHVSPAGDVRRLAVTVAPVANGGGLAAVCLLSERTAPGRVEEQVLAVEKLAPKSAEAG